MRMNETGDTIIEVILATVVISVVLAGAYTLSNRATRINQTAIERSTATNYMREQMEFIRGLRTSGYELQGWKDILSRIMIDPNPPVLDGSVCPLKAPALPSEAFFVLVDPAPVEYDSPDFIQKYDGSLDGHDDIYQVWVEAYKDNPASQVINFYVKACWEGIGSEPIQTAQLVMRIAE